MALMLPVAADVKRRCDFPASVAGEHMYAVYMQQSLQPGMQVANSYPFPAPDPYITTLL